MSVSSLNEQKQLAVSPRQIEVDGALQPLVVPLNICTV